MAIDDQGVRLDGDRFREVWTNATHLVRNAVDHGFAGVPDGAKKLLTLSCSDSDQALVLRFADNGSGIDWVKVKASAAKKGLPHTTEADLHAALFADGVSTRDSVTEISGRGVGMAAVKAAVEAAGGSIRVKSEPGKGTTFELIFPKQDVRTRLAG